jgi:ribosomal-protein-alanine N-acetyltransferase
MAALRERIVGHAVISVTAGESHILNLSIGREHHRQGFGRQFIEFLVDEARAQDAQTMLLEVRPSNAAAISCYNAAGFNEIGSRKDYYPAANGREDALLFARHITPSSDRLSG